MSSGLSGFGHVPGNALAQFYAVLLDFSFLFPCGNLEKRGYWFFFVNEQKGRRFGLHDPGGGTRMISSSSLSRS